MKLLSGFFIALLYAGSSFAGNCEYSSPEPRQLTYQKGAFLPVYFSGFQLDLPSGPMAFLSSEGFVAAYPDNGYIGVQHLDPDTMADSLSRLAKGLTSVSDFYRLIYGVSSSVETKADGKELKLQRALLKLDCKSGVAFYQRGDIQVIFHSASDSTNFHKAMLLNGKNVELITVRGSENFAKQVVASIKRRF
jgi:hypothetical protein